MSAREGVGRVVSAARSVRRGLLRAAALAYFSLFLGPRGRGWSSSPTEWDHQWREGDWEFLSALEELPRYAVIAGLVRTISSPPSVLDLGCGHGELWRVLGGEAVAVYHGVDIAEAAVEEARARSVGRATFEAADLQSWCPPRRFDIIVFNEVLYYVPDPVEAVERYRGWLADGGLIVVSMFRHRNAPLIWRDLARHFPLEVLAEVKNAKGEVVEIKIIRGAATVEKAPP